MKYLLLTRGMPLCGKTTWIQKHQLQDYTLCAKLFKNLTQNPMLDENGQMIFANHNEKIAFQMLCTTLETRMSRGDFIVIEDTHIAKSYFSNYKEIAKNYSYKIIIVDFSAVPLETIVQRHKENNVPFSELHLAALHDELIATAIPIKCDIIKPEETKDFLHPAPKNLNTYKVIHHIGDIQGSYAVLRKYLGKMNDDEYYIFLGDYIDRGMQNYEVLQFLISIMEKKNVCLLEGNHEKWLWEWSNNREVESKEFRFNTQIEFETKGLSKYDAKRFYQKLKPYLFYTFQNKYIVCTHGGISNIPKSFPLLSASQTIHGVGAYLNASNIAQSFAKNTPKNHYQIFGHRNKTDLPICLYEKNFILESQVEFGGYLRTLQLSQNGFKNTSIRNTIFVEKEEKEEKSALQKFFYTLQKNKKITLHANGDFIIPSYSKKLSNDILRLANPFYPLLIDKKNWQIAAKGYNLNTNKILSFATNPAELLETLVFPLVISRKQNGILRLITYYNNTFYSLMHSKLSTSLPTCMQQQEIQKELIKIFNNQSYSLLFTQTTKDEILLLDIIANQPTATITQPTKEEIAKILQIKTRKPYYKCDDKESFKHFKTKYDTYNLAISKMPISNLDLQAFCLNDQADSTPQNQHSFSMLKGFRVHDQQGNFFELPSIYDYELHAMRHFMQIWKIQNSITKLQWINNPLRESFFMWFQEYTINNPQWKDIPIHWIQNNFLQSLEHSIATMKN